MPTLQEFETRSAALQTALRAKLGVGGGSLSQALTRANRRLPKSVRRASLVLIQTQQKLLHPKIARQVDDAVVAKAFNTIEAHLSSIDLKERRKDARIRWLAMLILNMALVIALIVFVLRWRGYV